MQYCDQNQELRSILKDAIGVEPFEEFTKRAMRMGYIRFNQVADVVSYYVSLLALILAFVSTILSIFAMQLNSRYKKSRHFIMLGWFLTFLGPLIGTILPARLFLDWRGADEVSIAWSAEFDDEYAFIGEGEDILLDTCEMIVDNDWETMLVKVLDLCGDNDIIGGTQAELWGDSSIDQNKLYTCGDKYLDDNGYLQIGSGYPAVKRDPCAHLEDHIANQALSGVNFDLYEICRAGGLLPDFLFDGVVVRALSNPVTGNPMKIDWDVSEYVSGIQPLRVDFSEPLIKCGKARRFICEGDFDSAIQYAQRACNEAIAYLGKEEVGVGGVGWGGVGWGGLYY